LWALGKVRKGHEKVSPEVQVPLVAAEKVWERTKVRQFNGTNYLMKGALYVIRKAGNKCNNKNNHDTNSH
jgi:hypothetical protein